MDDISWISIKESNPDIIRDFMNKIISMDSYDEQAVWFFNKHQNELNDEERLTWAEYCWDLDHPEWRKVETEQGVFEVNQTGTGIRDYYTKEEYKIYYPEDKNRPNIYYPLIGVHQRPQSVHTLIAKAFVPNPENKPEVNHIDGIKTHNWYKNLEWVTASENHQHAVRMGLQPRGEDHPGAIYSEEQVRHVCKLLKEHPEMTFKEISKITGVYEHGVQDIHNGHVWTAISRDYVPFPPRETRARGEAVGNSKFTERQVEQVCSLLDRVFAGKAKLTYAEIAEQCGVSKMAVTEIASGRTWMHVASKHPFYDKIGRKREVYKEAYSDDQIKKVCELLMNPKTKFEDIEKETGINQATVSCIYRHESYDEIAKDYDFPERSTRAPGESNGRAVYTADQIEAACNLLDEGNLYVKDIAARTGVSMDTIFRISHGKGWINIAKNHPFYKKKFG